ncbi:MAG: HEAT repeat domain-containing protein [Planctomycetes bacterium]|nr:HEAT repeat domain-containing protein [Planctomycetota bacterium]
MRKAILIFVAVVFMLAIAFQSARTEPAGKKPSKITPQMLMDKLSVKDGCIRAECARVLGRIKCKEAVPKLIKLLDDEDIDVAVEVIRAIENIGDESAAPALMKHACRYSLPSLRYYAVRALVALGSREPLRQELIKALDAKEQTTVMRAVENIGTLFTLDGFKDEETMEKLVGIYAVQTDQFYKWKIQYVMWQMTGQDFGYDLAKMQAWWQGNKPEFEGYLSRPPIASVMENAKKAKDKTEVQKTAEENITAMILDTDLDESSGYYGMRSGEGQESSAGAFNGNARGRQAVEKSLNWLMRHQEKDGHWDFNGYMGKCQGPARDDESSIQGEYDVTATSLSLLCFLGAGYTHKVKVGKDKDEDKKNKDDDKEQREKFRSVIDKAVKWLLDVQDKNGAFVNPNTNDISMFEQAMATLALSELYGMTRDATLKKPAQKGIDFIISAQTPGLGWRYKPNCNDNDTSLVGWQVFALKSGRLAGLDVPAQGFEGASEWLDRMTDNSTGKVGYRDFGQGSTTITSVGIIARILMGWRNDSPVLLNGAEIVLKDDKWKSEEVNFYHIYQTSLAMFQLGGGYWDLWNEQMTGFLTTIMDTQGCEDGSWSPADEKWAKSRVYTTAMATLSLEVYLRMLPFSR